MTRVLGRCLLVCALASFCVTAAGAEKKSTRSTKSTASKTKATTEKEELTGRLPRYFSSLVDENQREEIYEIQASYRDAIQELEEKLAALKKDEMAAMEKVLTTTQRKTLASLRSGKQVSSSSKSTSSTKTASAKSSTSSRSTKAKPSSTRSSSSKKTSTKK